MGILEFILGILVCRNSRIPRIKIPPNPQPVDAKQKTQIKQENSRLWEF